jgi:hypothetical protein
MPSHPDYTCDDYREEMRLLGLRKRLHQEGLGPDELQRIETEIAELKKKLDMD